MEMARRNFLAGGALLAAGAVVKNASAMMPLEQQAWDAYNAAPTVRKTGIIDSEPLLQSPAPDSMGVGFAVNCMSVGFVEVADNPELRGAKRFYSEGMPVARLDDRVALVRMTGLKPASRYWYRVGAAALTHPIGYWTKQTLPEWGKVHSFTTPGEEAASHFGVINDTHEKWEPFKLVTDKLAELKVPVAIWNGDIPTSLYRRREDIVRVMYKPLSAEGFGASMPVIVNRGNHDFRGEAAAQYESVVMPRLASERGAHYWQLGFNYAYRQGDIALIGLDTGEDKPDIHPANGGFTCFEAYRSVQTKWLADQFKRPEIASAPFVVAFVHIPLFDSDPNANPGTILEDWASWQKQAADEWGPILNDNGVQLVVAGHKHRFRYDPPSAGRGWAQVVGGGPHLDQGPDRFPTVIEGKVENGKLVVRVHNLKDKRIAGEFSYERRTVR
ncbi:MAG: hypothetical protein E7046_04300 [Lentisphaerae bacterium]|nr:hypothetical protein [Lentisphaerota bacterium]